MNYPAPFGQYELLRPFARGGMGEVFIARSGARGFQKYCVLKKLRPELTKDREYVTRFIDEARVVVQLHHTKIAQVFDVGRVDEEYFLAMEYVAGRDVRTLDDKAKERGEPLPTGTVLFMITEILEALDYAHRRPHPETGELLNLVHRDVSPQNVLISFNGEVKLIDFGLAQSSMKVERTQPNIVMGKMAYMAPEHARGDPIDARADLFAVGVMAYELLAGERYYEGKEAHEIWQVVGRGSYRPQKWKTLPKDIRKVLDKALAAESAKRFESCGAFQDALIDIIVRGQYRDASPAALREVVQSLFKDAIENEQNMVRSFESVPAVAHDEKSRSQSVSLAHYDEQRVPSLSAKPLEEFAKGEKTQVEWSGAAPPSTKEDPEEGTEQDLTAFESNASLVEEPITINEEMGHTSAYVRTPTVITPNRRPLVALLVFAVFCLSGVIVWMLLKAPEPATATIAGTEALAEPNPKITAKEGAKADAKNANDANKDDANKDDANKNDANKNDVKVAKANASLSTDDASVDDTNAQKLKAQKQRQLRLKRAAQRKKAAIAAEKAAAEKERLAKEKAQNAKAVAPVSQSKKISFIKRYRKERCSRAVFTKAHTKADDPKGYTRLVNSCYKELKKKH